jgi:hypothetical protein
VWGAGFDTMKVPRLGIDGGFRILIRLVGTVQDFREDHVVKLTLTDPNTDVLGTLDHPIEPRRPGPDHVPGYEINHHFRVDVTIPLDVAGGYDLAFALDGNRDQRHTFALSVIVRE